MANELHVDAMDARVEGVQDEHEKPMALIPTVLVAGKPGDSKTTERVDTVSAEDALRHATDRWTSGNIRNEVYHILAVVLPLPTRSLASMHNLRSWRKFENAVIEALREILKNKQDFTEGYYPRENGSTERVNGTITRMLKKKLSFAVGQNFASRSICILLIPTLDNGRKPPFLFGRDPQYPSSVILREHLSPYQVNYVDYKTELLTGLRLARESISERAEKYRTAVKAAMTKGGAPKSLSRKREVSISKLTHEWRGPYRELEASDNSALITLIGENEEPLRIQFDHLVKVPSETDGTPIRGNTSRRRRADRKRSNRW
uniref:Integrase catalytic domain-containing protein n=1 Tax=Haemonchus placei TaxID=6290 RepID=A0A0N4W5T3_HAEPC